MNNSMCLKSSIAIMCITGVWIPDSLANHPKKQLYKAFTFILQTVTFHLIVLAEIAYIYMVFGNTEKTVDAAVLLLSHLVQEAKMMTIWLQQDRIKRLIIKIDGPEFASPADKTQPTLTQTVKYATLIGNVILLSATTTAVFWCLVPLLKENLALPLKTAYPFDITPIFGLMYLYASVSVVLDGVSDAAENYLVAGLLTLASAQLDVLSWRLQGLRRGGLAYAEAVECVKYHQRIIHYVEELTSVFRLAILFQIVISSTVVCMAVYKITTITEPVEFTTILFYLICVLMELMMYCYPGDLLMNKSLQVSKAAYIGDWVGCDTRTRKVILLLVARAQRPLVINAGGVYLLSLPTAAAVVQTSYSYYAVLKQTTK